MLELNWIIGPPAGVGELVGVGKNIYLVSEILNVRLKENCIFFPRLNPSLENPGQSEDFPRIISEEVVSSPGVVKLVEWKSGTTKIYL